MRILLQNIRSQLYVRSCTSWTANPFEAMDFGHSQRALEFALKNNIRELQIAVKFIDGAFDETAPLPAPAPYFHPMSLT